jgi:hypothetical protein
VTLRDEWRDGYTGVWVVVAVTILIWAGFITLLVTVRP